MPMETQRGDRGPRRNWSLPAVFTVGPSLKAVSPYEHLPDKAEN